MSIKKTLRLTLILCSIIPVIIVSILAYKLISNRLLDTRREHLQQLAETNSNGLNALVTNQQTEVNLLAIQSQIYNLAFSSQYVIPKNSSYYGSIYKSATKLLQQRFNLYPYCINLHVFNIDRTIIASSDPSKVGESYIENATLSYIKATKKTAIGISGINVYTNNDGTTSNYLEIGAPIINEDIRHRPIIGYVVSTLSITHFEEFLNSIELEQTGFGFLLDKSGTIIYHPDTNTIGRKLNSKKLQSLVTDYYKGSIPKSGSFLLPYNDNNSLFGYTVIPELNWVLLIKQDLFEVNNIARVIFYILGWTILAILIFIILVSKYITKAYTEPIIQLKNTMTTAANGDLNVRSNIKTNNEFGDLAKCFNKMLHIIRSNYNELADMHEELVTNEEALRTNYKQIEYLAYHDLLTNLPNKLSFIDKVNQCLWSSNDPNMIHAVYFVDLDNFKYINDTLGHDFGDDLLSMTSLKIGALLSSNDTLSRVGGDEFLIFSENVRTQTRAMQLAADMIEAFKKPFQIKGEQIYVSLSIGIALYPKNGDSTSVLIKNADIAMYKSKYTGKNKYTLFDKSMENELHRNTVILDILRNALKNNEVYIKYQPQINIKTGNIIGYEALMRIHNSKLGNISPSEFIPLAEESGLIVELGEWILRESCKFTKELHDMGLYPYIVSVNISSVQMNRPGFVQMVDRVLKESRLTPCYLELEITESTIVSSITDTNSLLHKLHDLGVRISLDDFGTGYSSLNYLTNMPINTLKIDKSFINNINSSEKDSFIAETIIKLAHNINVEVIAEGVEDVEQLETLKIKKCDIVQGFIFSKPLLPNSLLKLLQEDFSKGNYFN